MAVNVPAVCPTQGSVPVHDGVSMTKRWNTYINAHTGTAIHFVCS